MLAEWQKAIFALHFFASSCACIASWCDAVLVKRMMRSGEPIFLLEPAALACLPITALHTLVPPKNHHAAHDHSPFLLSLNMNITHLYDTIIDELRMIVKSIIKDNSYNFCLGLAERARQGSAVIMRQIFQQNAARNTRRAHASQHQKGIPHKALRYPFLFTMKPQEVKPKVQTDWLGFCKGGAQCPRSGRLCV